MTAAQTAISFNDVLLSSGVRLRYTDIGLREGEVALFLHGYSDSSFSFTPILGAMPPDLRLVIPDARGHGGSDRPSGEYSPDVFAIDALSLLDSLNIAAATVVGHSLGTFVAQRMAAIAPERVKRLVLVSGAATARSRAVDALQADVSELTDPVDPAFVREFQASTMHRPVPTRFLEAIIAESLKLEAHVWKAVLKGMMERPFFTEPGRICCPVAILWGEHDAIFGMADQRELLRRIPHAELHVLKGVGHAPHWEAPDEFALVLRSVLSQAAER
jgi:pimeloyl-ACP methyl ester carboxylesterase